MGLFQFRAAGMTHAEGYPENLWTLADLGPTSGLLVRRPENPVDPNAIAVVCVAAGGHLGWVPAHMTRMVSPLITGDRLKCTVVAMVDPHHPEQPGLAVEFVTT